MVPRKHRPPTSTFILPFHRSTLPLHQTSENCHGVSFVQNCSNSTSGARPTNNISSILSRDENDGRVMMDGHQLYQEEMQLVMDRLKPGKGQLKKVSAEQFHEITSFLLSDEPYNQEKWVFLSNSSTDTESLRRLLASRRKDFFNLTNFTEPQYELCVRCLNNLASNCAKKESILPVLIAWQKIKMSGMVLKPNFLSTFLYVLGLTGQFSDVSLEVATFHDILYGSTENSAYLRIKALVAMNDPLGAEELLEDLSNDECKRLRTFTPILNYYCETGDAYSILRLWLQIRDAPGAHLDCITYANILGSLARNKVFSHDAETIEGNEKLGLPASGPELLDTIVAVMKEDLLEITEAAAVQLYNDFNSGFSDSDERERIRLDEVPPYSNIRQEGNTTSNDNLLVGRVDIFRSNATCPCTGAKLRLLTLDRDQRLHLNNTLLKMAKTQQAEYGLRTKTESYRDTEHRHRVKKSLSRTKKGQSSLQAEKELRRFGEWLETREEPPFTAFVDGANVAYFGQGMVRYSQVLQVVNALEEMGERPLVIMPRKYVNASFRLAHGQVQTLQPRCLNVIAKLINDKKMFVVPHGLFDDYYWMLASVSTLEVPASNSTTMPGIRPILVSNDQMRDHKLELLEPHLFRRWYSAHICTYAISNFEEDEWEDREVRFLPADSFSCEIQGNSIGKEGVEGTAWHFPVKNWKRSERFCLALGQTQS